MKKKLRKKEKTELFCVLLLLFITNCVKLI